MSFVLYVMSAAWQDMRRQAVSGWTFLFFFVHFLTAQLCRCFFVPDWEQRSAEIWFCGMERSQTVLYLWSGCLIGAALLLAGHITEGAVGEGDGLFFLISGLYLGFWRNLLLLCFALLLCSAVGLVYLVYGRIRGRDWRKRRLPFLIFTVPAGIWLLCLG